MVTSGQPVTPQPLQQINSLGQIPLNQVPPSYDWVPTAPGFAPTSYVQQTQPTTPPGQPTPPPPAPLTQPIPLPPVPPTTNPVPPPPNIPRPPAPQQVQNPYVQSQHYQQFQVPSPAVQAPVYPQPNQPIPQQQQQPLVNPAQIPPQMVPSQYQQTPVQQHQYTQMDDAMLNAALRQRYGIDTQQLQQGINTLAQQQLQQDQNQLMQAWNVAPDEYARRVESIRSAYGDFVNMHPEYDSVQGLQTLWAQIEHYRNAVNPPSNMFTTANNVMPQYDFDERTIRGMSEQDFEQFYPQILSAYSRGRVLQNL